MSGSSLPGGSDFSARRRTRAVHMPAVPSPPAGVPAAAVVLLEKIPSITDPLQFQQYIATAEQIIQNSGTTLATALTRVQVPVA